MIAQEKGINLQLQPNVCSFWNAATQLSFPSAMWRLPNEQTRYFLTSFLEKPLQAKVDLDELPPGFSVAPFKNPQGTATYFLPADLLLTFDSKNRVVKTIQQPSEFDDDWQKFQQALKSKENKKTSSEIQSEAVGDSEAEKKRFVSTVENAIREINETDLLKVVLSRKKTFKINADRDVNQVFEKLCNAYPTAFVSAVYLPHLNQIWLGASPETLVSQDENGIYKTISLAGTLPAYDKE
ncbi:MAG: chorismate-binding protein, partial [Spirosomataceae bacterium]